MLKPIINPKLSLRARSLFYYYVTKGRVISADELWENKEVPEGRDAIRSAMSELKDLRYIKSVRVNVNGQWRTNLKFTDEAIKMLSTDDGISGVLYIDSYTASSYITSTNIDNNPNGLLSIGAAPLEEEKMAWNLDGEEKPKRKRFGIAPEEELVGTVGKIDDRQARLNAKYKKPVKAQHDSRDRVNTPEELWSTNDLVAEFYDLVQKAAPGVPSQVNGKYVATWVNKQVAEGTERVAILKAMRMFFGDPRSLHDTGIGKPLWQRFFGYYPTVHGIVTRPVSDEAEVDYAAHEEKMLRLLGGE